MSTGTCAAHEATWVTIRTAARTVGVSEWIVRRLVAQGVLRTLNLPTCRPKVHVGDLQALVAVKLDRALVTRARLIAADRGADLASYLTEALRGPVDRDWARMLRAAGNSADNNG